ncbi:MAG: hypothetical protein A2V67_08120 [Deltaproteobacteria bacterium RBG_13_61_14]|nr:MAG: hypothetical protein A2V67_08120 [Deltaproteobacteria bacterium RBG_13_61_14]
MKITSAEFVTTAIDPAGWPREGLPEAAFLGRSNVGKSSLINCLVGRKSLARTSSTPGRTRALNFFRVNGQWMFADLPGYGYANVSKEMRKGWQKLVEQYLQERKELRVAVLILDLRRPAGDDERDLIGWLSGQGLPFLLVATKADKLSRSQRQKAQAELAHGLGTRPDQIALFSARTREGREELCRRLLEGMGEKAG